MEHRSRYLILVVIGLILLLGLGTAWSTNQTVESTAGAPESASEVRDGDAPRSSMWTVLPNGPVASNRHDDVVFADENTGWVINGARNVFKTEDGGASWAQQVTNDTNMPFLRSIAMANKSTGWIGTLDAGADRVLYETRDGGERWTNISSRIRGSTPRGICGLWAVNNNVVYGVGSFFEGPWFIKSEDGGFTWNSRTLGGNVRTLIDVYFQNEEVGFAVGGTGDNLNGNAIILRTTNRGASWTEVYQSTRSPEVLGEWGWKISFPTELVGYVSVEYNNAPVGQEAKVLKTIDGGLTWTALSIEGSIESAGLQGIGFLTADTGWATGRGTTSMTTDGGLTWAQIPGFEVDSNPEGGLDGSTNRIFVLSPTLAFAVGKRTYKFDGATPVVVERESIQVPEKFRIEQNYPNPFSPSTTIKYSLFRDLKVQIDIRDSLGRKVKTLVSEFQAAGSYSATWDGTNENGVRMASGMYFYISDIGSSIEMKGMVLLN